MVKQCWQDNMEYNGNDFQWKSFPLLFILNWSFLGVDLKKKEKEKFIGSLALFHCPARYIQLRIERNLFFKSFSRIDIQYKLIFYQMLRVRVSPLE